MHHTSHPHQEAFQRAFKQLQRLSLEEQIAYLKEVGILTDEGELSPRYGGKSAPRATSSPPQVKAAG